jgi:hypothetical protein
VNWTSDIHRCGSIRLELSRMTFCAMPMVREGVTEHPSAGCALPQSTVFPPASPLSLKQGAFAPTTQQHQECWLQLPLPAQHFCRKLEPIDVFLLPSSSVSCYVVSSGTCQKVYGSVVHVPYCPRVESNTNRSPRHHRVMPPFSISLHIE